MSVQNKIKPHALNGSVKRVVWQGYAQQAQALLKESSYRIIHISQ
jgi:hypothetical protein